jgi:3-oxoadipate enol-lactonase
LTRLAYRVDGPADAPVVVLSPSLGTTSSLWDAQVAALAGDRRILRHDHPGHGGSPVPHGPVTVADIGTGLLDLLDELGVARASFCGISLGGMVGMWLGANAPDRIDRLVLACTGASLGSRQMYEERAALVRAQGTAVTLDGARERWFTPAFRELPRAQRVFDELLEISAEGYAACCEAVGAFDFHGELERVEPPALVVYGEEDPVTPPDVVDALVDGIPNARRAGIAHAAHLANVEQSEAFNAAVRIHLDERIAA